MFWLIIILLLVYLQTFNESFQTNKCNIIEGKPNNDKTIPLIVDCNSPAQSFTVTSKTYKNVDKYKNLNIINYPDLYKSLYNKKHTISNKDGCFLTFTPKGSLLPMSDYHAVLDCSNKKEPNDFQYMIFSKCGDSYKIHPFNRKNCYLVNDNNKLKFRCFSTNASAIKVGSKFTF